MAKIKFPTKSKYNGVSYPAHTVFEVDDKDLEGLVMDGCFIVEDAKPTRAKPTTEVKPQNKSVLDTPSSKTKKG